VVYRTTYQSLDGALISPRALRRVNDSRGLAYVGGQGKADRNQFALPAASICALYKSRWQVELFFKWIKQHLRIKQFYGTSDNAVRAQIWIAVSIYVLVAIVKKRLALDASLYTLVQIFSVTLFKKVPMSQAFFKTRTTFEPDEVANKLNLSAY